MTGVQTCALPICDRVEDKLSGKKTLIVRFGATFGSYLYAFVGIAAALLCLLLTPRTPGIVAAMSVYMVLHGITWRKMKQINSGKKLNSILGESSRNMLLLSILLSLAIAFGW